MPTNLANHSGRTKIRIQETRTETDRSDQVIINKAIENHIRGTKAATQQHHEFQAALFSNTITLKSCNKACPHCRHSSQQILYPLISSAHEIYNPRRRTNHRRPHAMDHFNIIMHIAGHSHFNPFWLDLTMSTIEYSFIIVFVAHG